MRLRARAGGFNQPHGGTEEALKAVAGIEIVHKNRKLRSRMFPFKDSA